jgi:CRISPR-associated protein Csb2
MVGKRLTAPRWAPKGFVEADLALVGFGGREVFDDLGAGVAATRWTSATPFLMTRHMKPKRNFAELLGEDLALQLKYRWGADAPTVTDVAVHADRGLEAVAFRQDRIGGGRTADREREARKGRQKEGRPRAWADGRTEALYLTVTFSAPLTGPLVLGRLCHFGFGRFTPLP